MRVIFANRRGIEELVDDELTKLPLNLRYDTADKHSSEMIPYKVSVLPKDRSYSQESKEESRIIDLVGPSEDVPNFMVASDECEQKRILKDCNNRYESQEQSQLIVLNKCVLLRELRLNDSNNIWIRGIEGVYLSSGYCFLPSKERGDPQEIKSEKHRIWEGLVESMTHYFLDLNSWLKVDSSKVIYDSERSKAKLIAVFQKAGLKKIE